VIRSFPLPNGCQPSTVRLTAFVDTSQGLCLLGFVKKFEGFRKAFLWHVQTAECLLKWPCLWVLRRGRLPPWWRVCPREGAMQGHCECLAATFTPPGLLPSSLLVMVHSCLHLGQGLHKHPAFETAKEPGACGE